jgi:hypothetical protein
LISIDFKFLAAPKVHIWRFKNSLGYQQSFDALQNDTVHAEFVDEYSKLIKRRESQLCLSFSFWDEPVPRDTKHIYELRSYSLKPGTLIEWGNNW